MRWIWGCFLGLIALTVLIYVGYRLLIEQGVAFSWSIGGEGGEVGMGEQTWAWSITLTVVAVYCIIQAIRDIRARRYAWAVAALIAAALVIFDPLPTIPISYFPTAL